MSKLSSQKELNLNLEKAIIKAQQLLEIGSIIQARDVLASAIQKKNPKTSSQVLWDSQYETAMFKLADICIDLRVDLDNKFKTALISFRIICHYTPNQQYASLEKVVRYFISKVEEKTRAAEAKARDLKLDIEDLEAEELGDLVASVSGEDAVDRSDREIVTPWLKFLWDSYKQILDVLKNHSQVQKLYQEIAQKSFEFCVKHKRSIEFRRMGEQLQNHLNSLENQPSSTALAESLELHLQIRFEQLKTCITLELWQEAPKVLDDLNNLLSKQPEPPIEYYALYFSNLANLFWISGNYPFHAYALHKVLEYYNEVTSNNIKIDKTKYSFANPTELANSVLLSTLIIPPQAPSLQGQEIQDPLYEKNLKLATYFSFNETIGIPTREDLLSDLFNPTFEKILSPELQGFITTVEKKYNPLQFGGLVQKTLNYIEGQESLKVYGKPLIHTLMIRLVQQIQRVYKNITFDQLVKLIPFMSLSEIEVCVVELARNRYVNARFDFQSRILNFVNPNSKNIQNHLSTLASGLEEIVGLLPTVKKEQELFKEVLQNLEKEHAKLISRQKTIDGLNQKRKEEAKLLEEISLKKKQEERDRERETQRLKQEAINKEREQREEQRKEQIRKFKAASSWKEYVEKEGNTEELKQIDKQIEKGEFDPDEWTKERKAKQEQERNALIKKYKTLEERTDILERAMRKEELDLLKEESIKFMKQDKEYYEKATQESLQIAKENHQRDLLEKQRFQRMLNDKKKFEEQIIKRQKENFEKEMEERKERHAKLREEREKEEEERRQKEKEREEERRQQEEEREEERRKKEEEERKKREATGKYIPLYLRKHSPTRSPTRSDSPSYKPISGKYIPPDPNKYKTTDDNWKRDTPPRDSRYSSGRRDDRKYDDRKYDDRKYDDKRRDDRKYDDRKYDDKRRDDRKYDDRDSRYSSERRDDRVSRYSSERRDDKVSRYSSERRDDRKYDDRKYDDKRRDDRKYDDRDSRGHSRNESRESQDLKDSPSYKPISGKYIPPDPNKYKTADDNWKRDTPPRDSRYSSGRRDDRKYDDRKYDDRKYDDRKYDDKRYSSDRKYDSSSKRDDKKRDDKKSPPVNQTPDEEGFSVVTNKKKR